jgi:hypothetical protein
MYPIYCNQWCKSANEIPVLHTIAKYSIDFRGFSEIVQQKETATTTTVPLGKIIQENLTILLLFAWVQVHVKCFAKLSSARDWRKYLHNLHLFIATIVTHRVLSVTKGTYASPRTMTKVNNRHEQ